MIRRYRRPGLLVAAVAALAAALLVPSFALAAVANETTLTVRFVDAVALLPVDRAAVHVTAHQDGAVIDEVDGETDAAGVSVLINLPHETGEGGPVHARRRRPQEHDLHRRQTGCVVTDTWDASRLAVPVDGVELTVEFTADEQQAVSSIECPPEVAPPTGEVGGAVGTPGATARATLPPTDTIAGNDATSPGSLAVIAALVGASTGLVVLVPRRRRAASGWSGALAAERRAGLPRLLCQPGWRYDQLSVPWSIVPVGLASSTRSAPTRSILANPIGKVDPQTGSARAGQRRCGWHGARPTPSGGGQSTSPYDVG